MKELRLRVRRGEGFEVVELEDTVRSPGYARIVTRLHQIRADCVDKLTTAPSWHDTLRFQGWIQAIDCALQIPSILKLEDHTPKKGHK